MTATFSVGVVISTYNNPAWLEKVLWGYMSQSVPADEIIIADDGSGEDTRLLVERYKQYLPIKHVWHEDDGFRKTRILNSALMVAESDYLHFTDQD
jgi:glycosyltransferase involved in cell wall biosynthesis